MTMVSNEHSGKLGNKRLVAGVCAIVIGGLGIHKFILGYATEGWITLLLSIFTCGLGFFALSIVGLIEGIVYLSKSDQEFLTTYVHNKKGWI